MSDNVRDEVMEYQPISELAETVDMSETWVRKLAAKDGKSGGWAFERRKVRTNEREQWPAPLQYVYRATDIPVAFGRGEQSHQALQKAIDKTERRIIGLESQNASKSKRIETVTEERDRARERVRELQSKVTELTTKADQSQAVADELEVKLDEMEADFLDLENSFRELFERHQNLVENQPSELLMQMAEEIEWLVLESDTDMNKDQQATLISLMRLAIKARRNFSEVRQLTATVDDETESEAAQDVTIPQQGSNTLMSFVETKAVAE